MDRLEPTQNSSGVWRGVVSVVRSAGIGKFGELSAGGCEVGAAVADAGMRSVAVPAQDVMTDEREDGLADTGGAAFLRGWQAPPSEFVDPPGPRFPFDAVPAAAFDQHAVNAQGCNRSNYVAV